MECGQFQAAAVEQCAVCGVVGGGAEVEDGEERERVGRVSGGKCAKRGEELEGICWSVGVSAVS